MPETPYPTSIISTGLGSLPAWVNDLSDILDITHISMDDLAHSANKPLLLIVNVNTHTKQETKQVNEIKKLAPKSQIIVVTRNLVTNDIILAYDMARSNESPLPFDLHDLLARIQHCASKKKPSWRSMFSAFWERLFKKPAVVHYTQLDDVTFPDLLPKKRKPVNTDLVPSIHVQFLKTFVVKNGSGRSISIKGQRIRSILACILYHGSDGIDRDRLIQYFWPDVYIESGRNSLNVAISQLRTALRPYFDKVDLIPLKGNKYQFLANYHLQSDIASFQALLDKAKRLNANKSNNSKTEAVFQQAIELYAGHFLPTFENQEWTSFIRDSLRESYFYALECLISNYLKAEKFEKAIQIGVLLLAEDNCMELVHRQLMYAYYKRGQRAKAFKQYEKCKEALYKFLEIEPSKETMELYKMIKKQERRVLSFPFI